MALRWGIIGCGNVAETKGGPALYGVEGSELVAVMSRSAEKGADFARRHGADRHYTRVDDLLADGEVDAVYIATPPHLHVEQTNRAAAAGKHVLCEKPMALTVNEGRRMIRACEESGVQLWVAYYRRCWPATVRMKALLDSGAIGRPMMARVSLSGWYQPPAGGPTPWRMRPAISGGGVLMDVGSHRLDLLAFLLGDVTEVSAFTDATAPGLEVDDSASLLLKFAGGAQAVVACHWNVAGSTDELEIGGTKGRMIATNVGTGDLVVEAGGKTETISLPPPPVTHAGLVERIVASFSEGAPNPLSGEDGLQASLMMEAAYRSAREGAVVRCAGQGDQP